MQASYMRLGGKSPLRSVHALHVEADGSVRREKLFERKRRRRGSKRLRPFERAVRRMSRAQGTMAQDYLARHDRSNRRKKNGWIKDMGKNVRRSSRKGLRKLKIRIL